MKVLFRTIDGIREAVEVPNSFRSIQVIKRPIMPPSKVTNSFLNRRYEENEMVRVREYEFAGWDEFQGAEIPVFEEREQPSNGDGK